MIGIFPFGRFPEIQNMALDEAMVEYSKRSGIACIRFYTWNQHCISFGFHQNIRVEIDKEYCEENDIPWVKRPTGGFAVMHGSDLTYSFAGPLSLFDRSPSLALDSIHKAIFETLRSQGIWVTLEVGHKSPPFKKLNANRPCFSAAAASELLFHGKKVLGSAQKRYQRYLLQHGSLAITKTPTSLINCLNFNDRENHDYKMELDRKSISLSESGKDLPGEKKISEQIIKNLEDALELKGQKLSFDKLKPWLQDRARVIARRSGRKFIKSMTPTL